MIMFYHIEKDIQSSTLQFYHIITPSPSPEICERIGVQSVLSLIKISVYSSDLELKKKYISLSDEIRISRSTASPHLLREKFFFIQVQNKFLKGVINNVLVNNLIEITGKIAVLRKVITIFKIFVELFK